MTSTRTTEKVEIDRQIEALRRRQAELAAMTQAQARRESMKFLAEAGIVTKQGKLAAGYR